MKVTTPDWVKDSIFYQIFPDRFARGKSNNQYSHHLNLQPWGSQPTVLGFQGGNLLGIVENLGYLSSLGINALYMNPIFSSASNHRYHTYDYFQVDPLLGGNTAFDTFLDAAHSHGIKVILDGVFNHASRGFFQFNHLLECHNESPYVDWFHPYDWPLNAYHEHEPARYAAWWGGHALPKFNTANPDVREFLWQVATFWLEKGVDGWRLDVPNEIDDDAFWQEFRRRCKAVNPDAYIVGELWHDAHRWLQGDQFDAQMNYPFTRSAIGFLAGNSIDHAQVEKTGYESISTLNGYQFADSLNHMFNNSLPQEIVLAQMNMLGSHDTARLMSLVQQDVTAVQFLFLCQMTVPGAPNIYYGDEIGMEGGRDPDCRRAFPWHQPEDWNKELLSQLQQFIKLRHHSSALRRGSFTILHADTSMIVYCRQHEGETAVVAFNTGEHLNSFIYPATMQPTNQHLSINNHTTRHLLPGKEISLTGKSASVWLN